MELTEAFENMKIIIDTAKMNNSNIKNVREGLNRYVVTLVEEKQISWYERRLLFAVIEKLRPIMKSEVSADEVFNEVLTIYGEDYKVEVKKKTKRKATDNGKDSKETN